MGRDYVEFAPLETERAQKLQNIINRASRDSEAVIINPAEGVSDSAVVDLISPTEKANGLVRYQRHYQPAA